MLATGGNDRPPSMKNPSVKWIFSTSLRQAQFEDIRPKTLRDGEPIRLIIVCRQEANKGTDIVLESLPILCRSIPNVVLDVVGGGTLLPTLKTLASSLGIEKIVTFHGKVGQAEVMNLLSGAHIFCYPTTASEGFPKVVVESLANGLPIVTTRVSVLPQLIEEGCGLLIEPTPDELAQAVVALCRDNETYREMSSAAIGVASRFTLEKWKDCIAENLREAWNPVFDLSREQVLQRSQSSV